MFKHEISYTDYNGQKRSEMFYFNLSRAELMEMELSTTNGVEEMIRMLIATKNNAEITRIYKELRICFRLFKLVTNLLIFDKPATIF